jgi:exodeoxyribonuclease V alpha subunit
MVDLPTLPPVGFGLLFHQFIENLVVTSSLTAVHRQSSETGIPAAAALIRRREMPVMTAYGGRGDEVSFVHASGREAIADATTSLYADLGGRNGDILIVTPVNGGPCGTAGLNRCLHDTYVEATDLQEMRGALGEIFSAGEPVMHRRNDYKRALFNGLMGTLLRIDRTSRSLVALFDGEEHVFENGNAVQRFLVGAGRRGHTLPGIGLYARTRANWLERFQEDSRALRDELCSVLHTAAALGKVGPLQVCPLMGAK